MGSSILGEKLSLLLEWGLRLRSIILIVFDISCLLCHSVLPAPALITSFQCNQTFPWSKITKLAAYHASSCIGVHTFSLFSRGSWKLRKTPYALSLVATIYLMKALSNAQTVCTSINYLSVHLISAWFSGQSLI